MSSSRSKLPPILPLMLLTLVHVISGISSNPRFLISLIVSGLWAYFDQGRPFWVRVTWWGLFLQDMNDSVRQARRVCESCITAKQDPTSNCGDSIQSLVDALIFNIMSLAIRYHYNRSWEKVTAESTTHPILSGEDSDASDESDSICEKNSFYKQN